MISGVLMPLDLNHRLKRLLPLILFWIPIYYIFSHWQENITLPKLLIKSFILGDVGQLYFLFVLLGLAIITPTLNKLIQTLSKPNLICLICLLTFIGFIWKNSPITFTYFIPYLGYYLIGNYSKYLNNNQKIFQLSKFTFLASWLILGFSIWKTSANSYLFQHGNPIIFLMTMSIFIILRETQKLEKHFSNFSIKIIKKLSQATLGVYIFHPIILSQLFKILPQYPDYIFLPVILLTFIIGVLFTLILKKIPLINKLGLL